MRCRTVESYVPRSDILDICGATRGRDPIVMRRLEAETCSRIARALGSSLAVVCGLCRAEAIPGVGSPRNTFGASPCQRSLHLRCLLGVLTASQAIIVGTISESPLAGSGNSVSVGVSCGTDEVLCLHPRSASGAPQADALPHVTGWDTFVAHRQPVSCAAECFVKQQQCRHAVSQACVKDRVRRQRTT